MSLLCYPDLDERLFRTVLPNGLTVCVVPRKGFSDVISKSSV